MMCGSIFGETMKAKKVVLGIKSLEEGLENFAETFKALESGKRVQPQPEGIFFTNFEAYHNAMNSNRFALLKLIRENSPDSINSLASMSGRAVEDVSEDLRVLVKLGLVDIFQTESYSQCHPQEVRFAE